MKRNLLYLILVTLFFFSPFVSYAEVSLSEPADTVQTYFQALKNMPEGSNTRIMMLPEYVEKVLDGA